MARVDTTEVDGEIRETAARYLAGEISRDWFHGWFVGTTWDDRTRLVAEIDHLLAEASLVGDEFDGELRTLISTAWAGEELYTTGSGMVVTQEPVLAFAGT